MYSISPGLRVHLQISLPREEEKEEEKRETERDTISNRWCIAPCSLAKAGAGPLLRVVFGAATQLARYESKTKLRTFTARADFVILSHATTIAMQ